MKTRINKKGFMLIVSIYVIIIFAVLGITVSAFIAGEAIGNSLFVNGLKALHITEGGIEYMIANDLINDFDWSNNDGDSHLGIALGLGEFDVWVSSSSPESATVSSNGYINRGNLFSEVRRQTVVELQRFYEPSLNNLLYVSGRINMNHATGLASGAPLVSGADINTGNVVIDGDVEEYDSIVLPTIDWNAYKNLAIAQGNYYGGDLSIAHSQSMDGIYYVEGNVSMDDNVTINGSLIVEGNINMNQVTGLYITPEVSGYPALIVGGNLNATHIDDSFITGLVYTGGNITMNNCNQMTIIGALLCGGRVSEVNASSITLLYDPLVKQTAFIGSGSDISITKWTNI